MSIARSMMVVTRTFTTNSVRRAAAANQVHPGYKGLKTIKDIFGTEDGTLIFKKGGIFDNLLYKATMATCVTAVILDLKLMLEIGFK